MITRAHKLLVAAVGATILFGSLTACSAPLPNGAGVCTLTEDYPHGSTSVAGSIDGKGKVKCTFTSGKLTNLSIETRLQKWSGSSWVTVSGTTRTTKQSTVKSGVTYTGVSGFISCRTGIFRTQSRSGGYLDGRYSGLSDWQTTHTGKGAKNPCVKPLQIVNVP